ncbi:MAG: hypothetical protein GX129_11965 [Clostridiales bacterium]|jgi:hypothetical protein|nr:hypothetical protein [Clostridiales bacterium]
MEFYEKACMKYIKEAPAERKYQYALAEIDNRNGLKDLLFYYFKFNWFDNNIVPKSKLPGFDKWIFEILYEYCGCYKLQALIMSLLEPGKLVEVDRFLIAYKTLNTPMEGILTDTNRKILKKVIRDYKKVFGVIIPEIFTVFDQSAICVESITEYIVREYYDKCMVEIDLWILLDKVYETLGNYQINGDKQSYYERIYTLMYDYSIPIKIVKRLSFEKDYTTMLINAIKFNYLRVVNAGNEKSFGCIKNINGFDIITSKISDGIIKDDDLKAIIFNVMLDCAVE